MADNSKKHPSSLTFRVTGKERAALEKAAAGMSLGAYIRSRLFDETIPPRRTRGKAPVKDHQALGQVLGKLGSSRISDSLNQLAREASSGSLPLTPETDAALRQACADIQAMRSSLLAALGLEAGGSGPSSFARASED